MSQGANFFESMHVFLKKGDNKDMAIDLKGPFKSEVSNWAFTASVPLEYVRAIVLLTYPVEDGEVYLDNLRLARGK